MKLQVQYNRITLISILAVLLIAAGSYYFLLHYVLIRQLDEDLKVEEAEIYDYVNKFGKLPDETIYKDQRIAFEETDSVFPKTFASLRSLHPVEKEMELSRQLSFPVRIKGQYFRATVTKSEEATQELIWIILFTTIALLILLTAILFFANRLLFKKLWQPFRNTLSSIKEFNLLKPVDITMQPTRITEFRELNESIRSMAHKVLRDYQSLKDFTDHASHEIQTPLAIINSKLDMLIQEPELTEKSLIQVQGIYQAADKLSRLSQSLLLLTRIENNQYAGVELVSVNRIAEDKLLEMQEWIRSKELRVFSRIQPVSTRMNAELSEILISNLIRNAVRHSDRGGKIDLETSNSQFIVANEGKTPLDATKIFNRFYKANDSDGSGLGLAIAKQVCNQYGFSLVYEFRNNLHYFTVHFDPEGLA